MTSYGVRQPISSRLQLLQNDVHTSRLERHTRFGFDHITSAYIAGKRPQGFFTNILKESSPSVHHNTDSVTLPSAFLEP